MALVGCGGGGGSAPSTGSVNAAPVWLSHAPTSAKEGHPYAYALVAQDANGDPLSFSLVTGPAGAAISNTNLAWTPTPAQAGQPQSFLIRVSDGKGGTADQTWTLTPSANAAPAFTAAAPLQATEGHPYSYAPTTSDADGDSVSLSATALPAGAAFAGGQVTWTPTAAQVGTACTFMLRASDGFGGQKDLTWILTPNANAAPVFSSVPPTASGSVYTYTVAASDPDGDAITYSLETAPTGATLAGSTLTWAVPPSQGRAAVAFSIRAKDALGASATQVWSVSPGGTITGTRLINAVTDAGEVPGPDNMSTWAPGVLAALVPDGAGGFITINGSGTANGTYTIPQVPGGYFWLKSGMNYFWTNSDTVDLGYDQGGRADAVTAASPATQLAFTVTGLSPWQSSDDLQWTVSNTGYWNTLVPFATHAPSAGDTALSGLTVPWKGWFMNDASKGDSGYLTQLVPQIGAGGQRYQSLAKAFAPTPFTQVDGSTQAVAGAFVDVPQTSSIRLKVACSQFAQFQTQVHPSAQLVDTFVALDVQPGGSAHGWLSSTPDLLTWYPGPMASDADLGDLAYGNPFPAAWTPFLVVRMSFGVPYKLPGTTNAVILQPGAELDTDQMPTATSPIRPSISPVQAAKVNGLDLQADQTGVGVTPTLSWTAPSLGSPTGYMVTIYHLDTAGASTTSTPVALLRTKSTSIQVPAGILTKGLSYCMKIEAFAEPGVDFETAPYRRRFPLAKAPLMSGILTP